MIYGRLMLFYSFNRVEVGIVKDEIEISERNKATFRLFDLAASNLDINSDSNTSKKNLIYFKTT